MFEDLSAGDLLPNYSVGPEFVKILPHDWVLTFPVLLAFGNEALKQLYKSNSPFLQAACINHCHSAAVFLNDQDDHYMPEWTWL